MDEEELRIIVDSHSRDIKAQEKFEGIRVRYRVTKTWHLMVFWGTGEITILPYGNTKTKEQWNELSKVLDI